MPFKNSQSGYPWTALGISTAPSLSGVYGIYNRTGWIYIGETGDIAARLGEHFSGVPTATRRFARMRRPDLLSS